MTISDRAIKANSAVTKPRAAIGGIDGDSWMHQVVPDSAELSEGWPDSAGHKVLLGHEDGDGLIVADCASE
jgi:hypothetical protein